ncbi:MAG: bifunctional oligoribonuclease/PAP phosphatase NrnA [Bacilli bacterium]
MKEFSKNINTRINEYKPYVAKIFKEVENADRIAVFAHKTPDFDAFGSQFGLATYLKEHYPQKEIIVLGENHYLYSGDLYPLIDVVDDSWFDKAFLAIIVDTGNLSRVSDNRYQKADTIIKIDHHPNVEPYGKVCFVDTKAVAVSEILALVMLAHGKGLSAEAASYLFSGIVGDSGRFKYASTTAVTFATTEVLINNGVDINKIYNKLYAQEVEDLQIMAYILNNFTITEHGFAYYIVTAETQTKLNIPAERAKENVNVFSGIRGVKAWAAITEIKETGEWRVSLRSAEKPINHIAAKWRGGGHVQASGATLLSKEEIALLVADIDNYLID